MKYDWVVIDEVDSGSIPTLFISYERIDVIRYILEDLMTVHDHISIELLENDDVRVYGNGFSELIRQSKSINND